jgi:uncharacterized membrane protein
MTWWRHIITGQDNTTVSIGRVLGLILFALFVVLVPLSAVVTLIKGVPAAEWGLLLDKLPTYLLAVCAAASGLIGLTGFTEPKPRRDEP